MDFHGLEEFANLMPTLPSDVVVCNGIPHAKWITRCVMLRNEDSLDVANGVCQNINLELVIDMDRKPLNDDQVAIQIVESLCEDEVPFN